MMVADVTVRAEDTHGGGALVFTTAGDPQELRARVAKLAAHHNAMHEGADVGEGRGPGGDVRASTARAEDTDDGARMVITPRAPADLEAPRTHVRAHASTAKAGTCPMRDAPRGG